jgi:hypothetical protein
MKKLVVLAVCLMVVASGTFALDKAVGGGFLFNASFTNGNASETYSYTYYDYYNGIVTEYDTYNYDWTMSRTGFGAFGFFGLGRFLELNLGFLYKNPNKLKITEDGETYTLNKSEMDIKSSAALQFGLYGKYPVPISDTFVFFPTIGADFELSLNSEEWYGWKWWHDLWIRGGVGLDIFFTERLFLRTHAIYGVAIPVGGNDDLGLKFGHGLLVKAGIGWMF